MTAHPSQSEKAEIFKALHERLAGFVIPNPWDIGTARLLAALGFEALASTSAGLAFSLGRRDGQLTREEVMQHAHELTGAVALPVSADLENGYGDSPDEVAVTIALAAEAGLVGGSIEDTTGQPGQPIYEFGLAVERVRAAVEAARALSFPFMLTARAENFLHGRPDLDDTIRRLQAFQEAGADVLYAPGLKAKQDIAAVISSVERPVNVVVGLQGMALSVKELSELGVKRISLGSTLSRVALGAFLRAAREMQEHGTFGFAAEAVPYAEINKLF
jgi:2-methylisocitrate lyase-like PEP mutase family enzyme